MDLVNGMRSGSDNAETKKSKKIEMAYLPGERPLINPWEQHEALSAEQSPVSSNALSCLGVIRGVSGKGSAYVEWGSGSSATKLVAIVRGPRQQSITRSQFEIEISFPGFAGSPEFTSDVGRDLASYVKESIEGAIDMDQYPCAAISIHIKVLQCTQSIHSLISPAISAATLACREGGICMKEPVVAVPVSVSESGECVVDPQTFGSGTATATVAFTTKSRTVCFLHLTGSVKNADAVDSVVNVADSAVGTLCAALGLVE